MILLSSYPEPSCDVINCYIPPSLILIVRMVPVVLAIISFHLNGLTDAAIHIVVWCVVKNLIDSFHCYFKDCILYYKSPVRSTFHPPLVVEGHWSSAMSARKEFVPDSWPQYFKQS